MSFVTLKITSPLTVVGITSVLNLEPGGLPATQNFENYVGALSGGNQSALLEFMVGPVQATATITSTGTATAAQTMTLLNVTLTAVASDPGENEFVVSGTVGTQAANIAACINDSTDLAGLVTATSLEGVVTVTSVAPGLIGNGLQIADVDLANVAVAAFSGGTNGTEETIDLR